MIFVRGCPKASLVTPSFQSYPFYFTQSQPRFHQIFVYGAEKQQPDEPNTKMNNEMNTKDESKSSETQQSKPTSLSIRGHDTELTNNQSSYTLSVDLPGVRPTDLKVQLIGEEGVLMINADRRISGTTKKYSRHFSLDEDTIDTTNIVASLVDGVLEINIPKKDKVKAEPIVVAVKTGYHMVDQSDESSSHPKQEIVVMDTPGVKSDSVKIELFEHRLTVQAERRKGDTVTTKYNRIFAINHRRIDTTQLEAFLADGVLTVVAPNKEPLAPHTISVSTTRTRTKTNDALPKFSDEEYVNVDTTIPETVSDEEAAEDEAAFNHN